jgi:hypothetical protein
MNYWVEKTEIFVNNDDQGDLHDQNYNRLMKHLYGHEFGKFLAEVGLTRESSIKFLIDALTYANDKKNEFNT